ncbi:MAG: hypothetical protein Q9216_003780 [Gyalolechia sp. 2 TL-2023]
MDDGPKNPFTKPAFYDALRPYIGLNTHRSKIVHKHRRRVWNHGFTTEALEKYESQVISFAYQLEQILSDKAGQKLNVNQYFYWFSFDVMGQFAFSKSFQMLQHQKWHHAVRILRAGLKIVGSLTPVPWLVRVSFDLPLLRIVRDFQAMELWCAARMDERIKNQADQSDANANRASDTAAMTMIYICYRLAKAPAQLEKLQKELDGLDSLEDLRVLQALPHLNGIINKTLRLHPAVPTGGLRQTPESGITVSGRFIPGNTVICAPRYSLGRLESCFENAMEFIPERWYSKPWMIKNKNAFAPFALGPYHCIGKNLALSELRFVTALLASKYDISFPAGEDGESCVEDMVDQFTAVPGPLNLVFCKREKVCS